MTPADQIRIHALLLEREGCFLRVHELEQAAAAILGEPYPFAQPPLPSNQRRKGKGKAKRKAAGAGRAAAEERVRLRKLEAGEAAYRVTYREGEVAARREETLPAPEALQTMLAAQGERLTVERIETLDAAGEVQAVLFEQS